MCREGAKEEPRGEVEDQREAGEAGGKKVGTSGQGGKRVLACSDELDAHSIETVIDREEGRTAWNCRALDWSDSRSSLDYARA